MTLAILSQPIQHCKQSWLPEWKFATGNFVESCRLSAATALSTSVPTMADVYAVDPYGNQKWKFTTQ